MTNEHNLRIISIAETKATRSIQKYGTKCKGLSKGQDQAGPYTSITEQPYYRMKYLASSTCEPTYKVSGFMSPAWQDWLCKILLRQYVHQLLLWVTEGEIKKDEVNRNYRYYFKVKPRKHQETSVRIAGPRLRFRASSTSKICLVYERSGLFCFRFSYTLGYFKNM